MRSENSYRVSITAMCIASLFLKILSLKENKYKLKKRKKMVVIGRQNLKPRKLFYKQLISKEEKKRYIKEGCEENTSIVVTDPKGISFREKEGYRIVVLE